LLNAERRLNKAFSNGKSIKTASIERLPMPYRRPKQIAV
jgi:hypothetical protein